MKHTSLAICARLGIDRERARTSPSRARTGWQAREQTAQLRGADPRLNVMAWQRSGHGSSRRACLSLSPRVPCTSRFRGMASSTACRQRGHGPGGHRRLGTRCESAVILPFRRAFPDGELLSPIDGGEALGEELDSGGSEPDLGAASESGRELQELPEVFS